MSSIIVFFLSVSQLERCSRSEHRCTGSLQRTRARARTDTHSCDVLQWWGAGIARRCTAHSVPVLLRVRALMRVTNVLSPNIQPSIHPIIHPSSIQSFIHSFTHAACVNAHSPIWTLLGNAPIVSPKLERMSRNQSGQETLILVRFLTADRHPAARINATAASRGARTIKAAMKEKLAARALVLHARLGRPPRSRTAAAWTVKLRPTAAGEFAHNISERGGRRGEGERWGEGRGEGEGPQPAAASAAGHVTVTTDRQKERDRQVERERRER